MFDEPKPYNGTTIFGTSQDVIDYSFTCGLPIEHNRDGVYVIMMDGTRLMALAEQQQPTYRQPIKRAERSLI